MTKQQIEAFGRITKGPWRLEMSRSYPGKVLSVQPVMRYNGLAQMTAFGRDYSQAAANGTAIAALPDLLAEREKMIETLKRISNLDPPSSACGDDPANCSFECVGCAARAVLAEIEGSE